MSRTWIQSLSGKKLEPASLTVEMVGDIDEIAHSLAGKFRFTAQTSRYYTVAEHCVVGSQMIAAPFAAAFLLHELSEVYLPDVATPLKRGLMVRVPDPIEPDLANLVDWEEIERHHTHTILKALGWSSLEPLVYSPEVKECDLRMLMTEKRDLLGPEPAPWNIDAQPYDGINVREPWDSKTAKSMFIERYRQLLRPAVK